MFKLHRSKFKEKKLAKYFSTNTTFFNTISHGMTHNQDLNKQCSLLQLKRLADPHAELGRLLANEMIHTRLNMLNTYHHNEFELPSVYHQMAYARSLEIYNLFNETHYVLHHGQSGIYDLALNILTTSLLFPIQNNPLYEFQTVLRHPIAFNNIYPGTHTVEWYKQQINERSILKNNDHRYTDSLIAADLYLASTAHGESALDYFTRKEHEKPPIKRSIAAMINHHIPDERMQTQFFKEFNKINAQTLSTHSQENSILFTICIDKNYFNECAYLSQPLGIAATLENESDLIKKMQEECRPAKCFPQARLIAHKLNSEAVKIFIFPAVSDSLYFHLIDDISALIKNYSYFSDIETLPFLQGDSATYIHPGR